MTAFTWNNKPVTSPLGKSAQIGFLILVPILIIALFVSFIFAMWNHDVSAILSLVAVGVVIRVLNLKKKPLAIRVPNVSDLVRFLGLVIALAGLWFHIEWFVILGLILNIRINIFK